MLQAPAVPPTVHHPAIALVSWKFFRTSSSFMTVTVGAAYTRFAAIPVLRCVILLSGVSVMVRLGFDQLDHLERLELLQGTLYMGLDISGAVGVECIPQRGRQ